MTLSVITVVEVDTWREIAKNGLVTPIMWTHAAHERKTSWTNHRVDINHMTDPSTEKGNAILPPTVTVLVTRNLIDQDMTIILLHFLGMSDMTEGRDLHLQGDIIHQAMDADRDHPPMIIGIDCLTVHIPCPIESTLVLLTETGAQKEGLPLWNSEEDQDHLQLLNSDDFGDIGHIENMNVWRYIVLRHIKDVDVFNKHSIMWMDYEMDVMWFQCGIFREISATNTSFDTYTS